MRDTRRLGTDYWASRVDKVTRGQNQTPNDEYLKGAAPADVSSDPDLIRYLQRKNAEFSDYNRERIQARKGNSRKRANSEGWSPLEENSQEGLSQNMEPCARYSLCRARRLPIGRGRNS